jgi:hypothetical protein
MKSRLSAQALPLAEPEARPVEDYRAAGAQHLIEPFGNASE